MSCLSEDQKLVTLARATRARTNAAEGAAVRDTDGRTYAAATVALPSLQPLGRAGLRRHGRRFGVQGTPGRRRARRRPRSSASPTAAALTDFGGAGVVVHLGDVRGSDRRRPPSADRTFVTDARDLRPIRAPAPRAASVGGMADVAASRARRSGASRWSPARTTRSRRGGSCGRSGQELHCTHVMLMDSDIEVQAGPRPSRSRRAWTSGSGRISRTGGRRPCSPHLSATAAAAEILRPEHPGRVTLMVGTEFSLTSPGMLPGPRVFLRVQVLMRWRRFFDRRITRKLDPLLKAMAASRAAGFAGPVTYGAGLWEQVDWSLFDIVGLNLYRLGPRPGGLRATRARARRHARQAGGRDRVRLRQLSRAPRSAGRVPSAS